jgi:hypothetical protein
MTTDTVTESLRRSTHHLQNLEEYTASVALINASFARLVSRPSWRSNRWQSATVKSIPQPTRVHRT